MSSTALNGAPVVVQNVLFWRFPPGGGGQKESLPVRWDAQKGALSRENPALCTSFIVSVFIEHVLNEHVPLCAKA